MTTKNNKVFNIWSNMYKDFQSVPKTGDGYSGGIWISKLKEKSRQLLNQSPRERMVYHDSLLPFLVSQLSINNNDIRVLDFGGGLGVSYIQSVSCLVKKVNLHYTVVELPAICKAGKALFKNKEIKFMPDLPTKGSRFEIIHIGSSLQYIDNWKDLLKKLAGYLPKYLIFTDLPAGRIPSFITKQKYYESYIPYRFYNLSTIVNYLKKLNYSLVFRSLYMNEILGKYQGYPMQNFPKKFQLGNGCNLTFVYNDK